MKLRRMVSCMMALLLACSLPVSAFAAEYDLAQGSVTVNATESGQTVTHGSNAAVPDSAPVITQSNSSTPTTNTVTITADAGATANVTLSGVNIDMKKTGGGSFNDPATGETVPYYGEAAVQITGNGDVTIELDGENTLQSGWNRAGVEKNNGGSLTITDENETHGSLKATGGSLGAGIGGGFESSGSNITVSGSAEVTAKGGWGGSGIGGGYKSSGINITVSGDAQVKAQGGTGNGAGAAIGEGGKNWQYGAEVPPNTDALTTNGKIEYYAPGANMSTDDPYKTVTGTYVPPQPEEPVQPARPLYRVIDPDGKTLDYKAERKDGVLTITAEADFAALTGTLGGIRTLKAQGIDTIVFVTNGATSTFALSDLLAQGGDGYTLTHDGAAVTFTMADGADVSKILQ